MSTSSLNGVLVPGQVIRPEVSISTAIELIKEHFDYEVTKITELNGYDDKNFFVKAVRRGGDDRSTQKFVFKVLNSMDSAKKHAASENKAMKFLQSKGVCCPVPEASVHEGSTCPLVEIQGQTDHDNNSGDGKYIGRFHIIRLLSFVEGQILHDVKITEKLLFKIGFYSGQLLTHLKDFNDVGLENHQSIWKLSSTPCLTDFLYVIQPDKDKFLLVTKVLEAFEEHVVPSYPNLEQGVIHGDMNEQNLIVRQTESGNEGTGDDAVNQTDRTYYLAGIIDFGDLQETYYVFELSILMTYMMLECVKTDDGIDPFEGSAHVLAGFMEAREVPKHELELLRICIAARLCQSLVLGQYSNTLDPTNQYLLTTARTGWNLLDRLWNRTSDLQLFSTWRKVIPTLNNSLCTPTP